MKTKTTIVGAGRTKLKITSTPITTPKVIIRDNEEGYFPSAFEKQVRSWPDHTMS